jgi:hypothetical protein
MNKEQEKLQQPRCASEKGCKNILVLCPKSAIFPWADQFIEWSNIQQLLYTELPLRKKPLFKIYYRCLDCNPTIPLKLQNDLMAYYN